MSTGFALWKGNSRDLDWGCLALSESGELSLESGSGSASVALDPARAAYVDVYVCGDWLCALGGADSALIAGRPGQLRVIAEVARATSTEGFDFETYSARFHAVGARAAVLAWEHGLALIDTETGVRWSVVHGDLNQRLMQITEESVELRGLYHRLTVALADGGVEVTQFRTPPTEPDADQEAFRHWMRGIGK